MSGHVPVSLHRVMALGHFPVLVQGQQHRTAHPGRGTGLGRQQDWAEGMRHGGVALRSEDAAGGRTGMRGCSIGDSTPAWECCKRGINGWLCLPCSLVPHGHGVPAARVLLRCLYRRCLATRWCRSPGLGQLRRGRDGSLPCLRWGPCLPCPACVWVPTRSGVTALPQPPPTPTPPPE